MKYLVAGSTPAGREGVRHKEDPLVRRPQNEGPDHQRGGASLSDEPRERRQVRRGALYIGPITSATFSSGVLLFITTVFKEANTCVYKPVYKSQALMELRNANRDNFTNYIHKWHPLPLINEVL